MLELKAYRDRNRVLLIFAPSLSDESYKEQKRLLEGAADGLRERDLVVLEPFEGEQAKTLRDGFKVSDDSFAVVLIGKDGGEKERFSALVEPTRLFGLIDQMPMRRREIVERER